jgi:hypothetical protein
MPRFPSGVAASVLLLLRVRQPCGGGSIAVACALSACTARTNTPAAPRVERQSQWTMRPSVRRPRAAAPEGGADDPLASGPAAGGGAWLRLRRRRVHGMRWIVSASVCPGSRLCPVYHACGVPRTGQVLVPRTHGNNLPPLSHPILQGKPNASHMCARIISTHMIDKTRVIPLL